MQENEQQRDAKRFLPDEMVTASELREFVFCERAWFLARQGFRVSAEAQAHRDAGLIFHEARAGAAQKGSSKHTLRWAILLALAGIVLLLVRAFQEGR